MARKEPTLQTLKKLFALSGNRCAFPQCEFPIVDSKGNILGQICHIEAAEKNGPRYNPKQTDEERRSFDNLLLLCANHHIVTNDVDEYTVSVLKKMKEDHEKSSYKFLIYEDFSKNVAKKLQKIYKVTYRISQSHSNNTIQINNIGIPPEEIKDLLESMVKNKFDSNQESVEIKHDKEIFKKN